MNLKLDLKSIVAGLVLGVVVMCAVGAGTPKTDTGRYRLAGSTPYFLLVDSVTGQVWAGNFQSGLKPTDADFFAPK